MVGGYSVLQACPTLCDLIPWYCIYLNKFVLVTFSFTPPSVLEKTDSGM